MDLVAMATIHGGSRLSENEVLMRPFMANTKRSNILGLNPEMMNHP